MLAAANVPWLSDALARAVSQIEPAESYLLEFAYILLEKWQHCLARSMPLLLVAFLLFQVAALPVVISLGSFWFLRMGPGNASGILLAVPPGLVLLVLIGLNVRRCPGRRPRELELTAVTKSTDTSKDIAMSSDPDASCEQVAVIDCGSPTSSRLVVGSTDTSKLVARSGAVIDCTSPTSSRFTL
ncbi:unnamed protein product [Symbiodinium natans]|uniref:Uncharacterized protein n=1 Tax=Symbiodinium natans TaxID=878477 RepID=A0A812NNW5_9DINO|nr:unnamed protein product [Symbiodinium natans]